MGGLTSVSQALVTLYEAGNSGYGAGAVSLGSAISAANGSFSIKYTPPAAPRLLYLVAAGGRTAFGANRAIELMAILGMSNALPAGNLTVNELTTAASVWTALQFISPTNPTLIGTSSTNAIGLENTLAGMANLVNVSTGQLSNFLPTLPECTGSKPLMNCLSEQKLDAFADIAAACVESAGPSASFPADCASIKTTAPACDQLLCYAGAANNVLQAAVNIALDPLVISAKGQALPENLVTSSSPFQPIPTQALNDATLALRHTSSQLTTPVGIAVDSAGNIWVGANNRSLHGAVFEYRPDGFLIAPALGNTGGGLNAPNGVAIDSLHHVWIANTSGAVTELDSNGNPLTPATGITGGGLNDCEGVAIDASKNIWVSSKGSSTVTKLDSTGKLLSGSGYTGGGLDTPHRIAIDAANHAWVANGPKTGGSMTELSPNGAALSPATGFIGGGLDGTHEVAIDPTGKVWGTNRSNNSVTELNSSGQPISPASGYTGGGISFPNGIAIDAAGHVFVTNQLQNPTTNGTTISELSSTGKPISPASGFSGPGLDQPHDMAIDLSGNLWITNQAGNSLTQFLGIAVPVRTPLIGPPQKP
ncbi:MAG: NHL repeat-containing protein [Candidatus Binataceae bacterium]